MSEHRKPLPEVPEPLPGPVVDSHCHLDVAQRVTGLDPEEALHLAAAVGVTRVVQVGCDLVSSRWAVQAAERWPSVIAAVALHPNDAARMPPAELADSLRMIDELIAHDRVLAVGETGLDFFRTPDPAEQRVQCESFAAHIDMSHRHHKTLVIHDRDAHDAVLDVLDHTPPAPSTVMHCFSGDAAFARECLDRGAYLSFPGTVTFKNNEPLREALAITPLDRILTETDAPYLTPMPHRGRSNASYLIPHTARFMAEVRGVPLDTFCQALNDNADRAFGGAWG